MLEENSFGILTRCMTICLFHTISTEYPPYILMRQNVSNYVIRFLLIYHCPPAVAAVGISPQKLMWQKRIHLKICQRIKLKKENK